MEEEKTKSTGSDSKQRTGIESTGAIDTQESQSKHRSHGRGEGGVPKNFKQKERVFNYLFGGIIYLLLVRLLSFHCLFKAFP